MTPTWVVILVGLGSGLAGTWLTISHERSAEIRTRMLNAADEFSTGTVEALQQARNSAGEVRRDETPLIDRSAHFTAEAQGYLNAANGAVDTVLTKQARVHLLFGSTSDAALAATGVLAHLRNMTTALDSWPHSVRDHDNFAMYSRNFEGVLTEHMKFNDAARDALTTNRAERLRRRLLRRNAA